MVAYEVPGTTYSSTFEPGPVLRTDKKFENFKNRSIYQCHHDDDPAGKGDKIFTMVKVTRPHPNKKTSFKIIATCFFMTATSLLLIQFFLVNNIQEPSGREDVDSRLGARKIGTGNSVHKDASSMSMSIPCEYKSLSDLKSYEIHPQVSESVDGNGRRHAYPPPKDGRVSLVCCNTTIGAMSIAVHHNWAPYGAKRFLDMVNNQYFTSKVALMRCVRNFICQ